MRGKLFIEFTCCLLILLFVYTAIDKVINFRQFKEILSKSELVGQFASSVAVLVPFIEIVIVFLLIIPQTIKMGLFSAFVLISIFTAYIAIMLISASKLPCNCGGLVSSMSWKQHLVFNICVCVVSLTAALLKKNRKNLRYVLCRES